MAAACIGVVTVAGLVALQPGGLSTLRITQDEPGFLHPEDRGSGGEQMSSESGKQSPDPVGPSAVPRVSELPRPGTTAPSPSDPVTPPRAPSPAPRPSAESSVRTVPGTPSRTLPTPTPTPTPTPSPSPTPTPTPTPTPDGGGTGTGGTSDGTTSGDPAPSGGSPDSSSTSGSPADSSSPTGADAAGSASSPAEAG